MLLKRDIKPLSVIPSTRFSFFVTKSKELMNGKSFEMIVLEKFKWPVTLSIPSASYNCMTFFTF